MSAAGVHIVGGRYVVRDIIATGGMGEVRFGEVAGAHGFRRVVAIKVVKKELSGDQSFVQMLRDEAHVVSGIHHANVAAVLDLVEEPTGLYLVMEYVHGETLSRLIASAIEAGQTVPGSVAVSVCIDLLEGLNAAHTARSLRGELLHIVHRDVSPQNVIVGADGVSRVLDFGIAKSAGRSQQTQDGTVRGKVAYMSPEQMDGAAQPTSDVYSAGIVLWEMLASRRYHAGLELGLIVRRIKTEPAVSLRSLGLPVPASLDAIVLRALEKDPARRFGSAREMADALRATQLGATPVDVAAFVATFAGASLKKRASVIEAVTGSDTLKEAVAKPQHVTDAIPIATAPPPPVRASALPAPGEVLASRVPSLEMPIRRSLTPQMINVPEVRKPAHLTLQREGFIGPDAHAGGIPRPAPAKTPAIGHAMQSRASQAPPQPQTGAPVGPQTPMSQPRAPVAQLQAIPAPNGKPGFYVPPDSRASGVDFARPSLPSSPGVPMAREPLALNVAPVAPTVPSPRRKRSPSAALWVTIAVLLALGVGVLLYAWLFA